jgi:CRP/FNR family cyclic AMP-dependent transcriptional regulator
MTNSIDQKLGNFFQQFPCREYDKGVNLLHSGTKETNFLFLERGNVKMTTTSQEGQNLVLHIFNSGSCISLLTLVNQGQNSYDFITITPTAIRTAPQSQVIDFLHHNPEALFEMQLRVLKGLQGLLNRIERSAFVPAYQQVAGLLTYFAHHFSEKSDSTESQVIAIRVTHQEIAEWLGLSRENVSIQMKKLEKNEFIRKQGRYIQINNLPQLEQLANPYTLT